METSGFENGPTPEHINHANEGLSNQSFSLSPIQEERLYQDLRKLVRYGIKEVVRMDGTDKYEIIINDNDGRASRHDEIDDDDEIDDLPDEVDEFDDLWDLAPEECFYDEDDGDGMSDSWWEG